jgi:hypothetical protein
MSSNRVFKQNHHDAATWRRHIWHMGTHKTRRRTRKDDSIRIRVTTEHKRVLTEAAARDGASVSTWLLMLGLRAAHDQATRDPQVSSSAVDGPRTTMAPTPLSADLSG